MASLIVKEVVISKNNASKHESLETGDFSRAILPPLRKGIIYLQT